MSAAPGTRDSTRVTALTQPAQVMPVTDRRWMVADAAADMVEAPGWLDTWGLPALEGQGPEWRVAGGGDLGASRQNLISSESGLTTVARDWCRENLMVSLRLAAGIGSRRHAGAAGIILAGPDSVRSRWVGVGACRRPRQGGPVAAAGAISAGTNPKAGAACGLTGSSPIRNPRPRR